MFYEATFHPSEPLSEIAKARILEFGPRGVLRKYHPKAADRINFNVDGSRTLDECLAFLSSIGVDAELIELRARRSLDGDGVVAKTLVPQLRTGRCEDDHTIDGDPQHRTWLRCSPYDRSPHLTRRAFIDAWVSYPQRTITLEMNALSNALFRTRMIVSKAAKLGEDMAPLLRDLDALYAVLTHPDMCDPPPVAFRHLYDAAMPLMLTYPHLGAAIVPFVDGIYEIAMGNRKPYANVHSEDEIRDMLAPVCKSAYVGVAEMLVYLDAQCDRVQHAIAQVAEAGAPMDE